MLAVFCKDLRIFVRDRWAVLFAVLVPVLVVTIIAEALFHSDGGPRLLVPVVNEDGGPVASTFMKLLAEHADVREVSRAEAERLVRDANKAAAAITFPPQLSKQYLQGHSTEIELLTDPAAGSDLEAIKVLGAGESTKWILPMELAELTRPVADAMRVARETGGKG